MSEWEATTVDAAVSLLRRGTAPVYVSESSVLAIGQRCVRNAGFDEFAARPHSSAIPSAVEPQAGDVLLNSTGTGTIGRSCVFPELHGKFMVDGHVTVLRTRPEIVLGSVLNEFLRSSKGQRLLESRCFTGSTNQVELSRSQLGKLTFVLPSLEEQRRIAEILDTIDETIQATERVIAKLELATSNVVRQLISNADGPVIKLGDLATYTNGFSFKAADWKETGSPIIRIQNLNGSRNFNYYGGQELSWNVTSGDLLFAWSRMRETSFGPTVWDGPIGVLNQHIFKVEVNPKLVDHYFFALLLSLHKPAIADLAHGFKDSFVHVTRKELEQFEVSIPTIDEQRGIVRFSELQGTRLSKERGLLDKLRTSRSGLAADLLSGRVRTVAS
jgi:type I restriction enzyme, S subunit